MSGRTENPSGQDPRHIYSDELATAILDRMAAGESLTRICSDADMPDRKTVWHWQNGDGGAPAEFYPRYARAVEDRADLIFDGLLKLSDDAAEQPTHETTGAAKLQVDTRKWVLARMNHRKYGDKSSLALEGGGKDSPPIKIQHTASLEDMAEALRLVQEISNDAGE